MTDSYRDKENLQGSQLCNLAWKIPWTEEPGRLQSVGSLRVGHNWDSELCKYMYTYKNKSIGTHNLQLFNYWTFNELLLCARFYAYALIQKQNI